MNDLKVKYTKSNRDEGRRSIRIQGNNKEFFLINSR